MLPNGAEQIEEMAMQFPQSAPLHSITLVQLRLIRVMGNWLPVSLCALAPNIFIA
jgi:hypothetical protein